MKRSWLLVGIGVFLIWGSFLIDKNSISTPGSSFTPEEVSFIFGSLGLIVFAIGWKE